MLLILPSSSSSFPTCHTSLWNADADAGRFTTFMHHFMGHLSSHIHLLERRESMNQTDRPGADPQPAMEHALERAIEVSPGTKHYPITDGTLVAEHHRSYRYVFTLDREWDVADGTDLTLKSDDHDSPLPVELADSTDTQGEFVVAQRLSEHALASATLIVERAHLLRKMKEGLSSLSTPANLGRKLFGVEDCADIEAPGPFVETIKQSFVPDAAQRVALLRSLASDLLLILGPPGTGKTDVLAAIALLHVLLYNHRVLIVSHTNIAVDNAIIRLKKFLQAQGMETLIEEQRMVRVGTPRLIELDGPEYATIIIEQIVNTRVQAERDEITRIEYHRATLEQQHTQQKTELEQHKRIWARKKATLVQQRLDAQDDLEVLEAEERERITKIRTHLSLLLEQDRQTQQTIQAHQTAWKTEALQLTPLEQHEHGLKRASTMQQTQLDALHRQHPFIRFFAQLFSNEWEATLLAQVEQIAHQRMVLIQQMAPYRERQAQALTHIRHAEHTHDMLAANIRSLTQKRDTPPSDYTEEKAEILNDLAACNEALTQGQAGITALEHAIKQAARDIAALGETLVQMERHLKHVKREAMRTVIQEAQVVGATLTGLYLKPQLLEQEWDVVILDEASMAPPPAVRIAANRAKSHLILIGDPLQLAPVCKIHDPDVDPHSDEVDQVQHWLGRDVFFHGGYTLQEAGQAIHHSVLLPYQGRMHPDICDLIRDLVYQGLLKDRTPSAFTRRIGPEPDHAVVLYDTSHVPRARGQKPKSDRSRLNTYHAELAVSLARQMLADMPIPHTPECLGIVTPYAAQRDTIKTLIQGTDLEAYVRVGTVHAFQGLEFDGVIFDTMEAPGLAIAPFLRGMWGSEAMRLLNVAVTRARHKLIIIAHRDHLRTLPRTMLLPQLVNLAAQKQCVTRS